MCESKSVNGNGDEVTNGQQDPLAFRVAQMTNRNIRRDFYHRMRLALEAEPYKLEGHDVSTALSALLNTSMALIIENAEKQPEAIRAAIQWGKGANDPLEGESVQPGDVTQMLVSSLRDVEGETG